MKPFLCLVLIALMGCTQIKMLPHLDEALILQNLSNEKTAQERLVKKTDDHFDALLQAIEEDRMDEYLTRSSVIQAFGPPVYEEEGSFDGQPFKKALYRYALVQKGEQRVYIYYDQSGRVKRWEKTAW